MSAEFPEIDYLTAKEWVHKELGSHPAIRSKLTSLPNLTWEKNEIHLSFPAPGLSKARILDSIQRIQSRIPNLRIHSMEEKYVCIQAMNANLFDNKSLLDNAKFRFFIRESGGSFEFSKPKGITEPELIAILEIFRLLFQDSETGSLDPKEILTKLGVTIYDPMEKRPDQILGFEGLFGYADLKKEIQETIVLPFQNPEIFDQISNLTRRNPGKNRPRAILFEGEPGVGKTSMARILSDVCRVKMLYVPIESIMSKYYGESAKNLSYIFDSAELYPESLLFLDEIDSLAGSRDQGMFEATRSVLSVLLRKLDGMEGLQRTILIGATNRKSDLDSALVSRFDRSIYFPLPNLEERSEILRGYARHLSPESTRKIAEILKGYSGRNLKDFCDTVERRWASKILEEKTRVSAPPAEIYENLAAQFS
jgi:ATP-dependent Zn protease